MYTSAYEPTARVNVGLIGTGYAAKLRVEALQKDERANLVAVAGSEEARTESFAASYGVQAISSWQQLVESTGIDLIIISTINRDHSAIARKALEQRKHVVVEYPLALDTIEASELIALAKEKNLLLHVEHIELLGGLHQAIKKHISEVGDIFYVRYNTVKPQYPAPRKWTYNHEMFGFPLTGALSRLHRLTDLFGKVVTVNCHQRFWQVEEDYYQGCFCVAQLSFESGLLGQVIYGKGETLWQSERKFEIHGEHGGLIFNEDAGLMVRRSETVPIETSNRKGLFTKDTSMVLDHLLDGRALYVTPEQSLYTMKVADAALRSAQTGLTIVVD
ncbi:homoserine dehydrogenase, NAD-binding protein [Calothrix sp. NIES-4071]|nr:homoserine dehydrogenase, NAD-binding protein [Calothrix sp. NIES-4071]BAZ59765.1 homoserine dehydrogenase, NAD-binding protein [Calothrix sp. NIES-4105]